MTVERTSVYHQFEPDVTASLNKRTGDFILTQTLQDKSIQTAPSSIQNEVSPVKSISFICRVSPERIPFVENLLLHRGKLFSEGIRDEDWTYLNAAVARDHFALPFIRIGKGGIYIETDIYEVIIALQNDKDVHPWHARPTVWHGRWEEADFDLEQKTKPILPSEFTLQSKLSRHDMLLFKIDLSEEPHFEKRTKRFFRQGVMFMRELLTSIGERDTLAFMNLMARYTERETIPHKPRRKGDSKGVAEVTSASGNQIFAKDRFVVHEEFVDLSLIVLRETLGFGRSFSQIAQLEEVKRFFPEGLFETATIESHLEKIFYFWLISFTRLYPEIPFRFPIAFERSPRYQGTALQSKLALDRIMTAVMMANTMLEKYDLLFDLGVSSQKLQLWMYSILRREEEYFRYKKCTLSDQNKSEIDLFCLGVLTYPRKTLDNISWAIFKERILKDPSEAIRMVDGLLKYLENAEKLQTIGSLHVPWVSALRWLRTFSREERTIMLTTLLKHFNEKHLHDLLDKRQGRSPNPKRQGEYLNAILMMLYLQSQEHMVPGQILIRKPLDPSLAMAFLGEVQINMETNNPLFNESMLARFSAIRTRLSSGIFSIRDTDALSLVLLYSKAPFDPYIFRTIIKRFNGILEAVMLEDAGK